MNNILKVKDKSSFFFKTGILFLPSALPISIISLLISILIKLKKHKSEFFKDKFNYLLILSSLSIIGNSIYNSFSFSNKVNNIFVVKAEVLSPYIENIWIDIFNWIPLFLLFWCFQYHLNKPEKREAFAKFLLLGSVPVIFSCLAQYWWGWEETLYGLNGLIVWYQKAYPEGEKVMSGLFSNPNYAGFWFSMIWPFSLILFLNEKKFNFKKSLTLIFTLLILYVAIMTNSRNALVGILNSFILLTSIKSFLLLLIIFALLSFFYWIIIILSPNHMNNSVLNSVIPLKLIYKLTRFDIENLINYPRVEIWLKALKLIYYQPLFGWGAGTFALLYGLSEGQESPITHTHNIFIELGYNYGLPFSILLFILIFIIFKKVFKNFWNLSLKSKRIVDKAWVSASLVSLIFNLSDMTYYDGRISIIFWSLLAGLKCIGEEKENQLSIE